MTPTDAVADAGHSDTDMSSPDGLPTNPEAWARLGAFGKAKGPPTKDPSLANLAFMRGHVPHGPPAAGAAAETVDLLSQTPAGAVESPGPTPAGAAGPVDASIAGADELTAALASMWHGDHTQTEMLQWAVQELVTRRADTQRDWEALRAAEMQHAADLSKLQVVSLGARDGLALRTKMERQMAEWAAREEARSARMAQLAQALDRATEALAEAKAIHNSLLESSEHQPGWVPLCCSLGAGQPWVGYLALRLTVLQQLHFSLFLYESPGWVPCGDGVDTLIDKTFPLHGQRGAERHATVQE